MAKTYEKDLTISKEELNLIGFYIEHAVYTPIQNGTTPERFEALKNIKARLEESQED